MKRRSLTGAIAILIFLGTASSLAQTAAPTNLKNVYNPIYPSPTAGSPALVGVPPPLMVFFTNKQIR